MSSNVIKKLQKGKSKQLLSWNDLIVIFNFIYGESMQELPSYPKVIGGVRVHWKDSEDVIHNVDHINDIKDPYESKKTLEILFSGGIGNDPQTTLWYWPNEVGCMLSIEGSSKDKIQNIIAKVDSYFPFPFEPIKIFISYDTSEIAIAEFIQKLIQKRISKEIKVFVAKNDIKPGEHPTKRMLEQELLKAECLIAICSKKSKNSPWLWWESASIWTRGKLLIPLFYKIKAKEFDGPMVLIAQGRNISNKDDLDNAIETLVIHINPKNRYKKITDSEWADLTNILLQN